MNKDYEKAIKLIENEDLEFGKSFVAIRFDYNNYKIGDILPESEDLTDDSEEDVTLDGTSCVGLNNNPEMIEDYGGKVYIVTGDSYDFGNDYGEVVVKNARIVAIVS